MDLNGFVSILGMKLGQRGPNSETHKCNVELFFQALTSVANLVDVYS
jgi:hypothetical protein